MSQNSLINKIGTYNHGVDLEGVDVEPSHKLDTTFYPALWNLLTVTDDVMELAVFGQGSTAGSGAQFVTRLHILSCPLEPIRCHQRFGGSSSFGPNLSVLYKAFLRGQQMGVNV